MRYRTILLFGAPGSGKGTQGKILGNIPGFHHSSSGDIFRTLDLQSEMGRTFWQFSSQGKLVPDEFTVKLLYQRQGRIKLKAANPTFPDIVPKEGQTIEVWGVVTCTIKQFKV